MASQAAWIVVGEAMRSARGASRGRLALPAAHLKLEQEFCRPIRPPVDEEPFLAPDELAVKAEREVTSEVLGDVAHADDPPADGRRHLGRRRPEPVLSDISRILVPLLVDELGVKLAEGEPGQREVLDDDGVCKDEGGMGRQVGFECVRERQAKDRRVELISELQGTGERT
jgi:hypothetical protein